MSEWSVAIMLTLVFVILKANKVINWSWGWVFSPLLVEIVATMFLGRMLGVW